jgi:hypothetical protein
MFCASGLIFGGTEGVRSLFQVSCTRTSFRRVGSHLHVLRARTSFRRYRGRQDSYLYFARQDTFSAVARASHPVFIFCAHRLVFGGTEGVISRFHVLRSQTRFLRYRGHRVHFSCFVRPDSFSAVPRGSGLVFMFCVPRLILCGTEGVRSRFHVLRARISFRRYRGRLVSFSCFALPDSFSAVPSASGLVFTFCAPELVFDGTEGVGSRFQVLCARTHFRRYRGRRVPFSCFACPDYFSVVPRASGPVFTFCAPELVFGGTEGVGSRFHVLRFRTHFRQYRGR